MTLALYHILILALIQGATEFLPISSSGHLVLTSQFLNLPDQGIAMDVAMHLGTVMAVIIYFWHDIWQMLIGLLRFLIGRRGGHVKLLANIIIATIPVVVAGYFLFHMASGLLRDLEIIAWATIGFGILLWISDKIGMTLRRVEHIGFISAFIIGCAQVIAIIPGTSRSGITITAARLLGVERPDATKFSMLLSIPTIIGAGILTFLKLEGSPQQLLSQDAMIAFAIAFISGLISIFILMLMVKKSGFGIFAIYRIILGAVLLYWVYI